MGRRKDNNHSLGGCSSKMHEHIHFEDADEVIEDAAESSNLDESICEASMAFIDSDDKTSADYYFDSYSHFGNFSLQYLCCSSKSECWLWFCMY